ncbi:hypothetical protein [Micromonospora sp. NPDC126480]|uniref:hypothetical protein n=1 Tax=Micromonospora sp. NPDC126480 TaxID=3155312 RepID=UPI00332BAFBB
MSSARSGRKLFPIRLGQPGRYLVGAAIATLIWFPARLADPADEPLARTVVRAGMYGAGWGLLVPLLEYVDRRRRSGTDDLRRAREALRRGVVPAAAADRAELVEQVRIARRGAWTGVLIGVPLFGGLALLAPGVDYPVTGIGFLVLLAVVLAVAVRALVRCRRADRRLAAARPGSAVADGACGFRPGAEQARRGR